jgi:adenylate cyclase, class 2
MTETEVKLRWPADRSDPAAYLLNRGFALVQPRTLEIDQLYDRETQASPRGELLESDQILRLRRSGDAAIVTYKGPASRETYKSREEIEFDISDPDALNLVLTRLGYQPRFRYEKYRTTFARKGEEGIVTLDETPVGVFLELEGPRDWIDATALQLGFKTSDYLTMSYAALYREYRLHHPNVPTDMIFKD